MKLYRLVFELYGRWSTFHWHPFAMLPRFHRSILVLISTLALCSWASGTVGISVALDCIFYLYFNPIKLNQHTSRRNVQRICKYIDWNYIFPWCTICGPTGRRFKMARTRFSSNEALGQCQLDQGIYFNCKRYQTRFLTRSCIPVWKQVYFYNSNYCVN